MATSDILKYRLYNQQLSQQSFTKPQDVVAWMGAMQAQDYGAAKWALGQRVPGSHDGDIEDAFTKGEILRTHVMRPTWHFVAPADIRWLLMLTAPRVITQCAHAYRMFELNAATFKRSHKVLEKVLQGGKQLMRDELAAALQKVKIDTGNLRFTHLIMRAELDGLICSGARQGKQFTYALLEERVPAAKKLTHDEALAELAKRYFTSHGPATSQDFAWWSGLTLTMAKKGIEMVKQDFINEVIEGQPYWFANNLPTIRSTAKAYLLPNYDEYIIAYKDRSALIEMVQKEKLDSRQNILFNNAIIINSHIAGTWQRTIRKNDIRVETTLFTELTKAQQGALNTAIKGYKNFIAS